MFSPTPHPFRDFELTGWQTAAPAYQDSFAAVAELFIPTLLEKLNITSNMAMLDVACGTGNLAAAATARGAQVIGVDFTETMLAQARQLYPAITFHHGDAEALSFNDEYFDAVAINFGVNHFPHPAQALKEAQRVLRTNGHLAFTVWAEPSINIAWQIIFAAIKDAGDPDIPLPTPPSGAVNQASTCSQLLLESGFSASEIDVTLIRQYWALSSAQELMTTLASGTVRMAYVLNAQPTQAQPAILSAIEAKLTDYAKDDVYHVPVAAHLAHARKSF